MKNNNELQIFDFKGAEVRILLIDDEPYFIGKDVATVLGYKNTRDALKKHVDSEDKNTVAIHDGIQGNPNQVVINESGMYSLVLSSKLPQAKEFKHWVTSEVLPTIRKHGAYLTDKKAIDIINGDGLADILALASKKLKEKDCIIAEQQGKIVLLENDKQELQKQNDVQAQQIEEFKPKVTYYDEVLNSDKLVIVNVIASDYGLSAMMLNKLLHVLNIQYKRSGIWLLYNDYRNKGYTKTKTYQNGYVIMQWTQIGRLFIYDLLKQHNILPLMEDGNKKENYKRCQKIINHK